MYKDNIKSDFQRKQFIEKINWYKSAIANTQSPYLKRDYSKAIKRMYRELKYYDKLHSVS